MKTVISSFIFSFSILLLFSCSKENSESPYANDSVPKIIKISEYYNGSMQRETSLTYDTSARLIKVVYDEVNEGQKYYDTIIYSTSSVIISTYNNLSKMIKQEVFSLNANKLAILMNDSLDDNKQAAKSTFKFSSILEHEANIYGYDANGYQTLEIITNEYGGTHRFDKTYSDGNLFSTIHEYMANDTVLLSGISSFTYYTDKTNSIGNLNRGISFLGKQNNNLLLSISDQRWHSTDTVKSKTNYQYEFDSHNRVVKQYILPQTGENKDESYLIYTYR